MKKLIACCALAALGFGLTGCLRAPVVPPIGTVFSELKAPLDIDYDPTTIGAKRGTAESTSILGLVATGDAGAAAAANQGGITKIHHADYEYFNVLGVFQRYTTVVYGE